MCKYLLDLIGSNSDQPLERTLLLGELRAQEIAGKYKLIWVHVNHQKVIQLDYG